MSELKTVGIISSSLKMPQQNYEHLITFFDIYKDPQKIWDALNDNRFELFGFLPAGFCFGSERAVERIVNTFNEKPEAIAFMAFPSTLKKECPYFINKRILKINEPIQNLAQILLLIKKSGLEARRATEEIFIYEHPTY